VRRFAILVDNERPGWPFTVTCLEIKEQIHQHMLDNGRTRIHEILSETTISNGAACSKNYL
jgi:hypothetical protein